jgi:hypothetical protein
MSQLSSFFRQNTRYSYPEARRTKREDYLSSPSSVVFKIYFHYAVRTWEQRQVNLASPLLSSLNEWETRIRIARKEQRFMVFENEGWGKQLDQRQVMYPGKHKIV